MTETSGRSDMAVGAGLLLGVMAVGAAIATALAAYSSQIAADGDTMQLVSGLTMAVAILAGCLAVVAIHAFE